MSVLSHRLKHIIRSTFAQFLGMAAIIAVGISFYIGFNTMLVNLHHTQDVFYADNNFADHYFYVVKAPEAVVKQVENVDGIKKATGRIQKDIPVLKDDGSRATVRLTSYSLPLEIEVNRIQILEGRYFQKYPGGGAFEVMIDPAFFTTNHINFGDTLDLIAENHKYPVTIVGTAAGPEFSYPMKDSSNLITDYNTFGIMMMPHNQAQKVLNLPGQINQVIVQFVPGADIDAAVKSINTILEPYGSLMDFPRQDQSSHAVLDAKLDGIESVSGFMPALFLLVAAAIQFVLISRMVKTQRIQIGILKAIGYNNSQIIAHFSTYTLIVGILGASMGVGLGIALSSYFSSMFAMYFNLPATLGTVNLQVIINSIVLALGVSLLAGLTASRGVVSISPAESMRPTPPASSRRSMLEAWTWLWNKLDTSWKMVFRTISRNHLRLMITLMGVAVAVGLLFLSLVAQDSVNYLMMHHFTDEISYDYMLQFEKPVKNYELLSISNIDGVQQTEGFFALPVEIHFNGKSTDDLLQGQSSSSTLKLPAAENGSSLNIPEEGIIISQKTAAELGVNVGDTVNAATALAIGPKHTADLRITAINHQLFGSEAYASIEQVNRIMQESSLVSGAMLLVNANKIEALETELAEIPGIASIQSRQDEIDNVTSYMDTVTSTIGSMLFFATLLGFVIIFNSVLLSFNERKRELISLLAVGFTHQEISWLLFKETIPQAVLGILVGIPAGRLLVIMYFNSLDFDMWTMPLIIDPSSLITAALGGIAFVLMGQWFANRSIKDLDIVELLKNTD